MKEDSDVIDISKVRDRVEYPILFVHGIISGYNSWSDTINKIVKKNPDYKSFEIHYDDSDKKIWNNYKTNSGKLSIWNVSYYGEKHRNDNFEAMIAKIADVGIGPLSGRLDEIIDIILKLTGHEKVVIIAHSMGGIVAKNSMTNTDKIWQNTHKLLTTGTPHDGVPHNLKLFDQITDLAADGKFIKELKKEWKKLSANNKKEKKLGVIGAIDSFNYNDNFADDNALSGTGLSAFIPVLSRTGFVAINSSIPFCESSESLGDNIGKSFRNTAHFGFRLAVKCKHTELQGHESIYRGLKWAIEKEY